MDRSIRQKISKETLVSNDMWDHMNETDTYRTFHPTAAEHTFFSSVHGIFSRTNYMLQGHKASLTKFKNTEIVSTIFSNHNDKKLEINYKYKTGKFTNIWTLNNMPLSNQWVNEQIESKIKKLPFHKWKWIYNIYVMQQKQF